MGIILTVVGSKTDICGRIGRFLHNLLPLMATYYTRSQLVRYAEANNPAFGARGIGLIQTKNYNSKVTCR